MTVAQLIQALEGFEPETEVRLAQQPGWPFEYSIGEVTDADPRASLEVVRGSDRGFDVGGVSPEGIAWDGHAHPDAWYVLDHAAESEHGPFETREEAEAEVERIAEAQDGPVVYIPESTQLGYLPDHVARALGWR